MEWDAHSGDVKQEGRELLLQNWHESRKMESSEKIWPLDIGSLKLHRRQAPVLLVEFSFFFGDYFSHIYIVMLNTHIGLSQKAETWKWVAGVFH